MVRRRSESCFDELLSRNVDSNALGYSLFKYVFNRADIESRSVSKNSLMPEGLLNDASDQDWADLYAYLKKL